MSVGATSRSASSADASRARTTISPRCSPRRSSELASAAAVPADDEALVPCPLAEACGLPAGVTGDREVAPGERRRVHVVRPEHRVVAVACALERVVLDPLLGGRAYLRPEVPPGHKEVEDRAVREGRVTDDDVDAVGEH